MRTSRVPRLPAFNTIGFSERQNVLRALKKPLSGYLGGQNSTGEFIRSLERRWASDFQTLDAIACNSATSGLLTACEAVGVRRGDVVWTTPFSMSATAAVAVHLGASVQFIDIEPKRFGMDPQKIPTRPMNLAAVIIANIFGHPAYLRDWAKWCKENDVPLIEDCAQSPFAFDGDQPAGTFGTIGVFSFNVHKHLQAGEGGIIVTNEPELAARMRNFINHGELDGDRPGLNLRMTEVTAAIVCSQLDKAEKILHGRRELALRLNDIFRKISWVMPSEEDTNCVSAYYVWSARADEDVIVPFVKKLTDAGIPLNIGYQNLTHIFDPSQRCLTTEEINKTIFTFEVCAYDPKAHHLEAIDHQVGKAAHEIEIGKYLP